MNQRLSLVLLLVFGAAVGLGVWGLAPVETRAEERPGWTRVAAVPAWVQAPPARAGWVRLVDGSQSNLLDLAYPDTETPTARRNVILLLLSRLAPVLGADARAVSEIGAASAQAVERVFLHQPPARGRGHVVGGTLYTVFVLWETPVEPVLAAVPATKRVAVEAALAGRPLGAGTPWKTVPHQPTWAPDPPAVADHLAVASRHTSGSWPVIAALADIRGGESVGSQVHKRLVPVVGSDHAFEAGVMVGGMANLRERVRLAGRDEGWQLWDLALDPVLACLPASHHEVARAALTGPVPPRAWKWEEPVSSAPAWVVEPLAWPEHVPVVQVRSGDDLERVHETSRRMGAQDVAEVLETRLLPSLGAASSRKAAEAGARRRQLVRKAIRQVAVASEDAEGKPPRVIVWTLWQVPLAEVIDALPEAAREAARAALR